LPLLLTLLCSFMLLSLPVKVIPSFYISWTVLHAKLTGFYFDLCSHLLTWCFLLCLWFMTCSVWRLERWQLIIELWIQFIIEPNFINFNFLCYYLTCLITLSVLQKLNQKSLVSVILFAQ
jgi:hypothetical protein